MTEEQVAEDTYNQGYADGKAKAWQELEFRIEDVLDDFHAVDDCGCAPCKVFRKVLHRLGPAWAARRKGPLTVP